MQNPRPYNRCQRQFRRRGSPHVRVDCTCVTSTTLEEHGSLFEGRFKSSLVEDDVYLLTCLRYIERNPVRAGMVADPGDCRWSGDAAHGFGNNISMVTPHRRYLSLSKTNSARLKNNQKLIGESLGADVAAKNQSPCQQEPDSRHREIQVAV